MVEIESLYIKRGIHDDWVSPCAIVCAVPSRSSVALVVELDITEQLCRVDSSVSKRARAPVQWLVANIRDPSEELGSGREEREATPLRSKKTPSEQKLVRQSAGVCSTSADASRTRTL